jgi:hypothetical protein
MRAPDQENGAVQVWRIAVPREHQEPAHEASLAVWLIDGPFHPAWHQWMFAVIHLRDIPGVPEAKRHFPGAGHEFLVMAINPDRPCDVDALEATGDWGDPDTPKYLTPADQVVQVADLTDEHAVQIGEGLVKMIVAGRLSPDQDFRSLWTRIIESSREHAITGGTHLGSIEGRA